MIVPTLLALIVLLPPSIHAQTFRPNLPPPPAIANARFRCQLDCDAVFVDGGGPATAMADCARSCGSAGSACDLGCPYQVEGGGINAVLVYDRECLIACNKVENACVDACYAPRTACRAACQAIGAAPAPNATPAPSPAPTTTTSLITLPTLTLTITTATPPKTSTKPSTAECVFYAAEITLCQGAEDVSDVQGVLSRVCDPKVITALGITSAALVFTPAAPLGLALSEATITLEEICADIQLTGAADKILGVVNKICRSADSSLADKAGACGLVGRRQADRSRRFFRHARRDVGTCALAIFPDPSITKGYASLRALCTSNVIGTDPVVDDFCASPGYPALIRFAQQVSIISALAADVPAESCAAVAGAVPAASARP